VATEHSDQLELSIVVACYQEEGHLEDSVRQIEATMAEAGYRYELVFLEDASTDATARILAELCVDRPHARCVFHQRNVGRGGTVAEGFRLARGRIVGFLDIDLEVPCRYVPAMVEAIRAGHDGATAYRVYRQGLGPRGLVRHVLSRGYRLLFRTMFRVPFRDTETGFKWFDRERILPVLDQTTNQGWFWDTELMVLAHRAGLDIVEVECPFIRRDDKKSTVRVFRDSWNYVKAAVAFRWRLRRAA
jgi:glycosyltransferase involved in cell wall biosynthesis